MANHLRAGGPNAIDSLIYDSAAVKFSASLDPLMDLDQKDILARPFISDAKMEANNNFEEEDLKCVAEMGDAQNMLDPHLGGAGGEEDESGDEEVWESVSELASDEEYVTEEEEEEGEEGDFEEEDEDDDGDDDDEDGEEGVDDEEEDDDEEEEDAYIEGENEMDDAMISSEDEGGEKCAICLRSFNDQEVGSPESCDHTFCFECIYEWSKNVTTCPVDRSVFSLILVRNTIHGEIVRQMEVKAQEAVDEDQDPTYCEVCGECDREDRLLLCDECDAGYHCECLTPPLTDIPIEEWYCPNCADHDDESSEEEYMSGLRRRPLRRVREYARAIARTQVAERVLSRVRQARELRRIDEEEQTGTTSTATRAPRVPKPRRKTTRKRKTTKRKTTKRKTTKRKTTKRKTTKRKTTKRKTTSTTTTTTGTKKKRRKTRRRKRKVRRTSAGARTAAPSVAKTIRRRIAGKLNLVKPKVGSMMPDMKQKGEQSLLFKRHEIGVANLSLTGGEHLFDPRDDDSHVKQGPGAQSAPTPARPLSATSCPSTSGGPLDFLGSIMQAGNILHMKSENIIIHKDGTLTSARKKDEKAAPKKSPTKTAHRPSTSSATSHHHNSEKGSSRSDPVTPVTSKGRRSSQAEGHPQGQQKSESRPHSSRVKESQEMGCDDRVDDLEPVEMDIDDDDDDDDVTFMNDVKQVSKGKESSIDTSVSEIHQSYGSERRSEFARTRDDVRADGMRSQNASVSMNEGQECQDRDEHGNDESDGDVGYHGNDDSQGGDGDDGYPQGDGDEDHGNQDENTVNNNNNNNGEGGGGGGEGEEGGEGGDEGEEGGGEEQDEVEEEEVEEEVEEEEEAEEEDASHAVEQQQEDYGTVEDTDGRNEDGEVEREEEEAFEDPMAEDVHVAEEEAYFRENVDEVEEEKEEVQVEEEQEVEEQEEELAEEEEQEEEEEEEGEQEEEEVVEIENDAGDTLHEQEIEEQNAEEEEDGEEEAGEEQREEEEEEDGEAEEGEDMDDEQDPQEEVEIVNENAEEEKGGDMTSSKPLINELECEDISDEDIGPGDGDHAECESDEEGMIKETSDGHVIEAKPKVKDSRKERRSEPGETRQTSTEVTESDVKHGASSAEEGEVKTDDESRKGKKTRGKRKRKPKKRNRDKRNVVVDPRKSISLHPLMATDIPRMPKRGEEAAGRREGSREAYGDLRQVIQVKRDTPYTAEELRRYHEEYWEEYNRRRDERRVERVGGTPWDQYTYDQYAYYEAWRNMGGEFAGGRPWGLHVQRDRSPIYDRRKNGAEPQALLDPRLEAQRESARKESERAKEEGSRKSSEKKTKSDSDAGRKDHATKKESTRSQKDEKDKSKKEKTKSKGHVHENSARDKNGREREDGEKDKKYRDKEKGKEKDREKDKESRDKHGHDKEKDRGRQKEKERERSRERDRSRKDRDHRSRDRDRHRSRDRERSRDRGREQSRDRHHKKSGERERSISRDNDHSRSKHRSRSRDRERSRKRERSSESDRVTSRDRRRDRSRERGRDRSREKVVRTSKDHDKPKERERTRDSVKTIKNEEIKSTSSVPLRKERGKVTVDASGVRKILLGAKATGKPKVPKKVVNKPAPTVVKVERVKVKKIKKEKAGAESKVEKKVKKAKVKGEKKLTKGKKKKAIVKRPLSFDVDEIAAPAKKKKAIAKRPLSFDVDEIAAPTKKKKAPATIVEVKVEDIVLKPPSPLKFDDADDMIPVPSTTRSPSRSPDELFIDIAAPDIDLDLSRTVMESPKLVLKAKSPADVAVADSSHLETDMYDPFEPTASPPSGIKSPSPIPSEASPAHDNATSSSLEVFKQASTPPPEVPPNPTSTTDVSSSDMATNPSQSGMTNEDRLMLASQASQQITKILNQLATVPVAKPRVSPESPVEQTMSSASIELGLSPEHLSGSSLSVSSLGSDDYKVDLILPQDNIGEPQEDDIEMSAVDLYNKNSRDRYLKKLYHQERVVEEVKLAIKPHYVRKTINKEDYKEILRKSVNQVCHSKTGEINPVKIRRLIDGYVKKAQHKSKKPSGGGDPHKSGKAGGGSAGKTSFKTSGKSSSKSAGKSASKATKEPASASKLIEKGRSLGLKSK